MRISIITPCYNSEKYIKETLKSIHDQNYNDVENILIDGKSTDNSVKIASEFSIQVISEKDQGQSDAINKGFDRVTGQIIAWQNADDLYEPDALQFVADFFTKNKDVGLIYGGYKEIDHQGNLLCTVKTKKWDQTRFKNGRFCPVQPTVFWRKEVLDQVGKLDLRLNYCMDVDFYCRVIKGGFKIVGVNQILGQFRVHDESKTQNSKNRSAHKKEYLKTLAKHFSYNMYNRLFFEFYYLRSQIVSQIKRRVGI